MSNLNHYGTHDADRMREKRAESNNVPIPPVENERRRKRCEKDAVKWLTTYLPGWFPLEFSPDQLEIIRSLEDRMKNGGFKCVAMDRGGGKTTIGKGMMLWGIFCGHIKFVFIAAATTPKAKKEFLSSILITLEVKGSQLAADYPEVCCLFAQLQGKALRANSQTVDGKKTYIAITDGIIFPTVDKKYGSKCCGSIIKAAGLTSSQRGAQHTTAEGDIIRPDFIFFDDPQTDESARSEKQTEDREKTITAMVGMSGAGKKIGGYMACTVIEPDDLSERFLNAENHPEWYGTKYQMVKQWPKEKEGMWNEYLELRKEDMRAHDRDFTQCMAYYRANFDAMNEGGVMAWEGRRKQGDLSALQSAFNLVIEVGGWPTFMSEYQNEPIKADNDIYNITPDVVASRVNGFARYEIPPEAKFLVAMCDINFVGINYCVCAFTNEFTGWVVDYGKYPERGAVLIQKNTGEADISRIVSQGVLAVHRLLSEKVYTMNGRRVDINRILFDGNKWTESVFSAVKAINQQHTVIVDRGTAASRYRWQKNLIIGNPYHKCHYEDNIPQKGKQIRHNADYWRMATQKAFLLAPGVPGSLSLYGKTPQEHRRFADEICGEKLIRFEPGDPIDLYHWTLKPGQSNDLLDCAVGCYVAAATLGAVLPGMQANHTQQRKKPRRKPKVEIGT